MKALLSLKEEGRYKGHKLIEEMKLPQVQALADDGMSVSKVVSEVGIARRTYYNAIDEGRI